MTVTVPAKLRLNEPAEIRVEMRNDRDETVTTLVHTLPEYSYALQLFKANGSPAPDARKLAPPMHRANRKLEAGQALQDTIDLKRKFDLADKGEYRLTIGRRVWHEVGISPEITVWVSDIPLRIVDENDR